MSSSLAKTAPPSLAKYQQRAESMRSMFTTSKQNSAQSIESEAQDVIECDADRILREFGEIGDNVADAQDCATAIDIIEYRAIRSEAIQAFPPNYIDKNTEDFVAQQRDSYHPLMEDELFSPRNAALYLVNLADSYCDLFVQCYDNVEAIDHREIFRQRCFENYKQSVMISTAELHITDPVRLLCILR
jgi:hypothetical protein